MLHFQPASKNHPASLTRSYHGLQIFQEYLKSFLHWKYKETELNNATEQEHFLTLLSFVPNFSQMFLLGACLGVNERWGRRWRGRWGGFTSDDVWGHLLLLKVYELSRLLSCCKRACIIPALLRETGRVWDFRSCATVPAPSWFLTRKQDNVSRRAEYQQI